MHLDLLSQARLAICEQIERIVRGWDTYPLAWGDSLSSHFSSVRLTDAKNIFVKNSNHAIAANI